MRYRSGSFQLDRGTRDPRDIAVKKWLLLFPGGCHQTKMGRRWELGRFVDDVDGDKKEVGERTDESQRQYKVNNRGGGRRCRPSQTGDLAESGEESRRGRI